METMYYYFLTRSIDQEPMDRPFITFNYIGDIGDYVEFDGVGYVITDYVEETVYEGE